MYFISLNRRLQERLKWQVLRAVCFSAIRKRNGRSSFPGPSLHVHACGDLPHSSKQFSDPGRMSQKPTQL